MLRKIKFFLQLCREDREWRLMTMASIMMGVIAAVVVAWDGFGAIPSLLVGFFLGVWFTAVGVTLQRWDEMGEGRD